jgi:hypothetical protein
MTNAIAYTLSSLAFGATDLQRADLTVHFEITKGLDETPATRGEDTVVPHLPGQISRSYEEDVLDIELYGFVQGDGATEALRRASFRSLAEEIKSLFAANNEQTLSGVDAGSHTYEITAKPIAGEAVRPAPQAIPGFRYYTILLVATNPFWVIDGGGS